MLKLAVVGGGRMGEALVAGLLAAGWAEPAELAVVEPVESRRTTLADRFPGIAVEGGIAGIGVPTAVVIAVKPGDVVAACQSVAATAVRRVLSIAAGVTLGTLEQHLAPATAVVRAMPNTPALVGAGAAAIAAGSHADDDDVQWAEEVLGAVGVVVRVSESLLDAVTGLSGSGPAYVFLVAEALIEGGVLVGLPRDVSATLAIHTLLGASRLLAESGDTPEALRAGVTSQGGTTAAGLRALEDAGVRAAFLGAVEAATVRARQLGA